MVFFSNSIAIIIDCSHKSIQHYVFKSFRHNIYLMNQILLSKLKNCPAVFRINHIEHDFKEHSFTYRIHNMYKYKSKPAIPINVV